MDLEDSQQAGYGVSLELLISESRVEQAPLASPPFSISLLELFSRPEKEALVPCCFGRGDLVMVFGDSGSGKTFVVLNMIVQLSLGGLVFGSLKPGKPLNCLYCTEEGQSGIKRRFKAACNASGILEGTEAVDRLRYREFVPRLFRDEDALDEFLAGARTDVFSPDVIVIDHLSDAAEGADENDNSDAQIVASRLARIANELDCVVIVVHHSRKDGGSYRGASGYKAKMDAMFEVVGIENPRTLRHFKSKNYEPFEGKAFKVVPSDPSAVVEWIPVGSVASAVTWQDEVIQILRSSAICEESALTVSEIHSRIERPVQLKTLKQFLSEKKAARENIVLGVNKLVRLPSGKNGRQAWHYYADEPF